MSQDPVKLLAPEKQPPEEKPADPTVYEPRYGFADWAGGKDSEFATTKLGGNQ